MTTTDKTISFLKKLFSGCWFGRHGNLVYERNPAGALCYRCDRCCELFPILWMNSESDTTDADD